MIDSIILYEKHKIQLIVSKQEIEIRPILVKEEKILMMGKEYPDNEFLNSIFQVVENCTLTPNFNWKKQSYTDFVYAFIELRKISKDSNIDVKLTCNSENCGNTTNKRYDLNNIIEISNKDVKSPKIVKLTDDIGVELSKMNVEFILKMKEKGIIDKSHIFDLHFEMVKYHIESVLYGEERKDNLTDEDKDNFVNSLRPNQFKQLVEWFSLVPFIEIKMEWKCKSCGKDNVAREVDIINFLDLS